MQIKCNNKRKKKKTSIIFVLLFQRFLMVNYVIVLGKKNLNRTQKPSYKLTKRFFFSFEINKFHGHLWEKKERVKQNKKRNFTSTALM